MLKKNKNKPGFIMDTDWLFQGILDAEQKEYILLSYFQKINQNLEELKIYPMFTDLSLHLGNIQTLLTKNQILYTNKNFYLNNLEELTFKDLKLKNIPQLTSEEYEEYQKILRSSQSKLFDYFNIAKAVWSIAYDSIQIKVVKNFKNTSSPIGFFYFEKDDQIYVWKYVSKKIKNENKTQIKQIYVGEKNLTVTKILIKFSLDYKIKKENLLPVFYLKTNNDSLPLEETLLPIFKRKVIGYVTQTLRKIETVTIN